MSLPHELVKEDCRRVATNPTTLTDLKGAVILISGGTGFLGTWLAEVLAVLNDTHHMGVRVILLSRSAKSFATRLPYLGARPDFELIQADVANVVDLPAEVTHIIHAGATPDSSQHASEPLRLVRTVVNGTQMVVDAASRLPNLKKLLNVSSGQVYGPMAPNAEPVSEHGFFGFDSASVSNAYAEAKRMGEQIASAYRSQNRMPIVNVRPFAFLGPYQRLDRPWAINNFIREALQGGPIRIHGDGQTIRSYMYGADAAWWLLNILARGDVGASYNLGSQRGVSLGSVAQMVTELLPSRPKVTTGIMGEGVPRSSFVPSVALAQRTLGLEITTTLEEALRRTILWNRDTTW
jgi:nucleoside-diphosphate-sugar epimerase